MKKIMRQRNLLLKLSLLFFLLIQFFAKAQEYVPFPDTNVIWSEVFVEPQPYSIDTYQYGICGDTVINSLTYKKIYLLSDTIYPIIKGQYCGSIRENNTKKIFAIGYECTYPGTGEDEELLYDFSKSVGDTIFVGIDGIGPNGYLVIDNIDSILIDNNYRKTFYFTNQEAYWIEGIGSTRGLFSPITAQPTGAQKLELICFNQDGYVKFLNPEYNTCFPVLTSLETQKLKEKQVSIYPHPITDISIIDFSDIEHSYQYMLIYNLLGQKCYQIDISRKKQVLLNKSDYKSGLYIYYLFDKNQRSLKGKIFFK